jgi:RNA polymerase sigma-70 factor, ECF subfamily
MHDEPEVLGLLALMLLEHARRDARAGSDGELVPLPEQDIGLWDRQAIAEGQAIVRRCLRRNDPGPYQIQAAINAVHSDAAGPADTDWNQILALYDQLMSFTPTPVVALNRAVALAEVDGPRAALEAIEGLPLERYYLYHAIRADLLRRLGDTDDAAAAYQAAIERTENRSEIVFLERRRRAAIG